MAASNGWTMRRRASVMDRKKRTGPGRRHIQRLSSLGKRGKWDVSFVAVKMWKARLWMRRNYAREVGRRCRR